ncbi:MAG: hypothetical protein IKR85_11420 [Clostridia bacterium]|nr:hypothetical protein [Clostridia bacterium]
MRKILALLLAVCMLVSCAAFAEEQAEATYTYNLALTTFPTNWNPHVYETNTDSIILDWTSTGYYRFDYNDTMDGYKMVPDLATDYPIDVTADYIGQYGLEEGAEHQAWLIPIREDVKWEDGTPITAHDIEESVKRLLNPVAVNYRADTLYTGNVVIAGAKDYFYSGQSVTLENATNAYYTMDDLTLGEDGVYVTPDGGKVYLAINYKLSEWLGGNTLKQYVDSYGEAYFDVTNWDALVELANDEGLVELTEDTYALFVPVTTGVEAWGETEDDIPAYFAYEATYPELEYDGNVGYFALSDYEVVMVLEKPCEGFYLMYGMSCPLVKNDLYDACTTITDGVYSNSYGTSLDTIMSYGPYKLTSFQMDKVFTLEKNEYFYGYNDGADIYQTTCINYDYVPEASTRLEMFLAGQLDSYGLQKDDMEEYAASDFIYYSEGDSIFAMVVNPDLDTLTANQTTAGENINKTILTIKEFRMALAYAMNRAEFCLATSPTNGPAFCLYSSQIIADPENGIAYRATPEAKQVIVNFWGLADDIGEGKLYADVDEAIDSISGYNLAMAQEYFDKAYDIAIEEGLMDEDDVVEIIVGTPNLTSAFYNNGYEYIVNNYTEAVKGTKLEGKLTFTRDGTLGNDFAKALRNNNIDMLFGVGWTGSTFDPYNLFQVFVSPTYQYDSHYDATADMVDIELNGVVYTASAYTWYESMQGTGTKVTVKVGDEDTELVLADAGEKIIVLAALENNYLQVYDYIPLMNDASASLKGAQVKYYTEDEVFPMGRGGVRYMTYNYTDAEWDAYVADMGGTINYK